MSSRELLVLLEELPETSLFKIARDRTYRVVKYIGSEPLRADDGKITTEPGDIKLFIPYGALPDNFVLLAEKVVDWTKAEHVQARIARELMVANYGSKADFTDLIPPLHEWTESEIEVSDDEYDAVQAAIDAQLHGRR
jgi:hypothetical protein